MEFDEPFAVEIEDQYYLIVPLHDETFDVHSSDGNHMCNIYSEIGFDTELTWGTSDLVPLEIVAALGLAIERREK
jgi:hypothetical protein